MALIRDFIEQRRHAHHPWLPTAGLAVVVAMLAAVLFEYNFGDSEFLMLLLTIVTLPYAAGRAASASTPAPTAKPRGV